MSSRYKDKTREGEKVRELDCPDGYKAEDGRCVKMAAREMKNRSRSANKAKRVQGNKQKYIDKKRLDTIEQNEGITMEDKLREMIREELKNALNEVGQHEEQMLFAQDKFYDAMVQDNNA